MRSILILSALLVCSEASAIGRRRVQACPQPQYVPVSTEHSPNSVNAPVDALGEVNAARAARGLPPYIRDEGLSQAATAAASYRSSHGIRNHTSNDFAFLPSGSSASAAGCGGLDVSWGWAACCTYDRYTYAGAASVVVNGIRYNHIFVRH